MTSAGHLTGLSSSTSPWFQRILNGQKPLKAGDSKNHHPYGYRRGERKATEKVSFPGTACYAAPYKVLPGHCHPTRQNLILEEKFYLWGLVRRSQHNCIASHCLGIWQCSWLTTSWLKFKRKTWRISCRNFGHYTHILRRLHDLAQLQPYPGKTLGRPRVLSLWPGHLHSSKLSLVQSCNTPVWAAKTCPSTYKVP